MMTDDKFLDRANKFLLVEDMADNKLYAWADLKARMEVSQKNKANKVAVIYTTDPLHQHTYIEQAQAKGYVVVKLDTMVDNGFVSQMEMKWNDVQFVRVDSDIAENLVDKQENNDSVLSKEDADKLKTLFALPYDGMNLQVEVKGLATDTAPVIASQPEFSRRMKDMAAMGGSMGSFYANMPTEIQLTINGNHPVFTNLLKENDESIRQEQIQHLSDLALLGLGLLKGKELSRFIARSFSKTTS
jgi:molecular chaperone HtpG